MRGRFSADLVGLAKTDNAPKSSAAKVQLRELVMGHIDQPAVFDAFAGEGHMHDAVWCRAVRYVGCDQRFVQDNRTAFVADNRRVLRVIDLDQFNLFDLDACGSPWDQAYIIAHRRLIKPAERIGLVLTEGQGLKMKMGGMSRTLARLAGLRATQSGLASRQDEIVSRALGALAVTMNASVTARWQATGKHGSHMLYIGVILEGKP